MEAKEVLSKYKEICKKDIQLNLGSFNLMYMELFPLIGKEQKEKISQVYKTYTSMRDGCELNTLSIEKAIGEMESILAN